MNWKAFWTVIAIGVLASALGGGVIVFFDYVAVHDWHPLAVIGAPVAVLFLAAAIYAGATS